MSNFDPAAATVAYLDVLSPAAHAKATAYTQGGHWLLLWSWLISVAVALLILRSGVLRRLGARLQANGARPKLFAFVAAVAFSVIDFVLELPWTSYAAWGREKGYGLTHQSWTGWFGEQVEMTLISALLTGLLVMVVYTLIRRLPRSWWAWSGAVVALFLIAGLVLSPVLIEPLFNTYTPAPPGPVRDAVVRMATAVGVPHDKIFVYNGSKQSDRYTANVSGIAGSARVAMSDTMFKQGADLAEVRGVVGHEMGHYVLQHALMSAAAFSLIALLVLWLVDRLFLRVRHLLGEERGVAGLADPAGLPILAIIVGTLLLLLTPLNSSITRITEQQADDFSVTHMHEPDGLAKALVKTIEYRAATPSSLEEAMFYDHPSVGHRIRSLMNWKAAHPDLVGAPPS